MDHKKSVLIGVLVTSLIIFKIQNFKIGPCSPELENLINE